MIDAIFNERRGDAPMYCVTFILEAGHKRMERKSRLLTWALFSDLHCSLQPEDLWYLGNSTLNRKVAH
jgi:hypothetical protein